MSNMAIANLRTINNKLQSLGREFKAMSGFLLSLTSAAVSYPVVDAIDMVCKDFT